MNKYPTDKVFKSTNTGDFKVINYISAKEVEIEFLFTGTRLFTTYPAIKAGYVKDYMAPRVSGVGYLGNEVLDPLDKPVYRKWVGMVERCYIIGKYPAYSDCTVADTWHNFQNFLVDYNRIEYNQEGWHLDKDLLYANNKVYSSETCVFIPPKVNQFIVTGNWRGDNCPIGVCWDSKNEKYKASIRVDSKSYHLGVSDCPQQAFSFYKKRKEELAKILAERYKEGLDPRAYNSLMNFTIESSGRVY